MSEGGVSKRVSLSRRAKVMSERGFNRVKACLYQVRQCHVCARSKQTNVSISCPSK